MSKLTGKNFGFTDGELAIAIDTLSILSHAIYRSNTMGPHTIPAGHLYAASMAFMSLEAFQSAIAILQRTGMVKRDPSHLLTWVGPDLD